jgi:putative hydroxymethylpyrimidine transport system substrate-binding protein
MKKIMISLLAVSVLMTHSLCYANVKLVVLLDWFANPDHAPLFVAEQQGYFKEAGLDVELIGPADPSDPPKLVAAGKADIAITYEPQFIEQVDQGLPLIRIGTLIDKPLDCLAVLKNSDIHSLHDLKNKQIGYSSGGVTDLALKTMLEKNGLHLNDVQQALLTKKVDAVTGMMRTFEVIQMELAGHPAQIFLPEQNGVPTYNELIFVANKKNIHDPRLPKFLSALQKGTNYLKSHPEETWNVFAKSHPELNDQLNHRAWQATLPYFALNPNQFNQKEWLQFASFMQKNGLIKKVQPINEYAIKLG